MKNNESLEKIISLEDIDYVHFWGTNDKVLDFVRILFPKLKLIVRGEMLKLVGAEEDIDFFATYCQGKVFLIPVEECSGAEKSIRFTPTKSGQVKGINFAT